MGGGGGDVGEGLAHINTGYLYLCVQVPL
jgi:hypothetical protein